MNEFAGNGKLHDARAENMIHHYAVMLFDDFTNDAKVVHIENRLRDMLRNYDDNIKWGIRDVSGGDYPRVRKSPPLMDDRRWAVYADMAESAPRKVKDGEVFKGGEVTVCYEDDGSITVLDKEEMTENDPRE
jgi:hypothetical protein